MCLHLFTLKKAMDEARWERIERTIEYLTNQQAASDAKFSAWNDRAQAKIDDLIDAQARHEVLIEASFARMEALERAQQRAQQSLTIAQEHTQKQIDELVEAQLRTDDRLNALIGVVDFRLNPPPQRAT